LTDELLELANRGFDANDKKVKNATCEMQSLVSNMSEDEKALITMTRPQIDMGNITPDIAPIGGLTAVIEGFFKEIVDGDYENARSVKLPGDAAEKILKELVSVIQAAVTIFCEKSIQEIVGVSDPRFDPDTHYDVRLTIKAGMLMEQDDISRIVERDGRSG